MVELLGRYSRLAELPRFTLESRTARHTDRPDRPAQRYKIAHRLSAQERSAVVAAYVAGASSQQVAKQFQLSKRAVLDILNEAGVIRPRQFMSQEDIVEAAKLYGQGWSLLKIGEHLNFGQGTVWRNLTQHGVPMRKRWDHPAQTTKHP